MSQMQAAVRHDSPGRVALITGAGSGIGRAAALALGGAGFDLALVGRTEATLGATAELLLQHKAEAHTLVIADDIAQPRAAEMIIARTIERWGRLDVLVNNAAILRAAPIDELCEPDLRETFAVNVSGPALLVARAWPYFLRQGGARIVNVSSLAASDPFAGLTAYAASKAALESLTRSIAREGAAHGIRAFALTVGAVETAMLRSGVSEAELPREAAMSPDAVARIILECALGARDRDAGRSIIVGG